MVDIKKYDFQRAINVPKGTDTTTWYVISTKLKVQRAPWEDDVNLCIFKDAKKNLLGVRWVGEDGHWQDL